MTGVISAFMDAYDTTLQQALIYIYFLSFYILFLLLIKSFSIMVVYKYYVKSESLGYVAEQQVIEFKKAWNNTEGRYSSTIGLDSFLSLLKDLKYPLGIMSNNKKLCFLDLTRFAKRVLLCMPLVSPINRNLDDNSTNMFSWDVLPADIR